MLVILDGKTKNRLTSSGRFVSLVPHHFLPVGMLLFPKVFRRCLIDFLLLVVNVGVATRTQLIVPSVETVCH